MPKEDLCSCGHSLQSHLKCSGGMRNCWSISSVVGFGSQCTLLCSSCRALCPASLHLSVSLASVKRSLFFLWYSTSFNLLNSSLASVNLRSITMLSSSEGVLGLLEGVTKGDLKFRRANVFLCNGFGVHEFDILLSMFSLSHPVVGGISKSCSRG